MARSSKLNRTLSIALSLVLATTFGLPVAAWASGGGRRFLCGSCLISGCRWRGRGFALG